MWSIANFQIQIIPLINHAGFLYDSQYFFSTFISITYLRSKWSSVKLRFMQITQRSHDVYFFFFYKVSNINYRKIKSSHKGNQLAYFQILSEARGLVVLQGCFFIFIIYLFGQFEFSSSNFESFMYINFTLQRSFLLFSIVFPGERKTSEKPS